MNDDERLPERAPTTDAQPDAALGTGSEPADATRIARGPRRTVPSSADLTRILRRPAVVFPVAAMVVVLVAGLFAWGSAQRDNPGLAAASGWPVPSAPAPTDPWASLEPGASFEPLPGSSVAPAAVLTARGARGAVVPLDTGFRLASVDGSPASALAARLTVEPAFAYAVAADAADRSATITPKAPLRPGTVYRFSLAGPTGEILDTWAFQSKQPLRIVGTLPEQQGIDVPIDTGIEVIFDQDGVTDAGSHFSIDPPVKGRFEQHGRVLAFIPERPLAHATIYTVTVSRGVSVPATGEATASDTVFAFETAAKGSGDTQPATFEFPDDVNESPTGERPTLGLWSFGDFEAKPPKTTRIDVYRLAGLDAAIAAFRTLRSRPTWSRWSTDGLIDVSRLTRTVGFEATLNSHRGALWFRLPDRLRAGWFVVQQSGGTRPAQTILQVSDVAGYLAVSDTKTLVWANDVATGDPLVGAAVMSEGVRIARTDAQGLALGATPEALLGDKPSSCAKPCDPVVVIRTVDGRQLFLPAAVGRDKFDGYGSWFDGDTGYWTIFHTDRSHYRRGDAINLWGVIRDRDTGRAPATVVARLFAEGGGVDESTRPSVGQVDLRPDPAGAFSGTLRLGSVPEGSYTLALSIGARVVRTVSVVVGPIAKPAYRLEVTTGRRVYVAGDRIRISAAATFYEGTPVPGVPLQLDGLSEATITTGPDGTATLRTTATAEDGFEDPDWNYVRAAPARAEEGEIAGDSREVIIFPSLWTISAEGVIRSGRVVATGGVHTVAVDRLEAEIASGSSFWELDPRGAAVRGAVVTVAFTELIPVRRQVGTKYDFIEKKVVPLYDTDITERAAGTVRVRTAADGSWTANIPAGAADHDYRIVATVGDPDGRLARRTAAADRNPWIEADYSWASLLPTDPARDPSLGFGVGERIDLTMTDPQLAQRAGDGTRYLFFTAQRGIRVAKVQDSRRFVATYARSAVPNVSIAGLRFNGRGYSGTAWFEARFRAADRRLDVDLSVAETRYAPGETVTVSVRTRDAAGQPAPATVILRAIDEKLYTIGAAEIDDPLNELYAGVSSGVGSTYESHRNPRGQPEGGDTTGGGGDERDDFRDSLLFRAVTTNAAGRASVSFKLSDDLTSWRVTGSAISTRLEAGIGAVVVPVGLPFFVDASIAPEYLTTDRPSIAIRTYGSALAAGASVTVTVTSKTLGFDRGPIRTTAFATDTVALPALRAGTHTVTITATTGIGASARTDRLTRTFAVVDTRLTRLQAAYVELPATTFRGGPDLTHVVISDAGGGRYLELLNELAGDGGSARADRALAADLASALLVARFGPDAGNPDVQPFPADRYAGPDGGLGLLPYASSDIELSAWAALAGSDRLNPAALGSYFRGIEADRNETRERRILALAGLAGLGEPVLPSIVRAGADPDLTIRERLMVGLGAATLGDAGTARAILAALVAKHGERLGREARLRVGTSATDITEGTALAAVLAASVGDPLGPDLWAYVEANRATYRLEVLTAVAYTAKALERLPVTTLRFAYTIDGVRRVADVPIGEAFEMTLTASQLGSLAIQPLAGTMGVATTWREPVGASAFQPDPDVTMTREVRPSGAIANSDLVVVDLIVTFGPQAAGGCHEVTELVPSGLTPVGAGAHWPGDDGEDGPPDSGVISPYEQTGSRVSFCVEPSQTRRSFTLRYVARVVTPGIYAWEPAVALARNRTDVATLTPATTLTIR